MVTTKSKWTSNDVLKFLDDNFPEISVRLMGLQLGRSELVFQFGHKEYGRLFASKVRFKKTNTTKLVFFTSRNKERSAFLRSTGNERAKAVKAYMNTYITVKGLTKN